MEDLYEKYGSAVDRLADTSASVDVFQRQFGAELTSWELEHQKRFQRRISSTKSSYRGYVHYTRDTSVVLLSPSPWLLEGVLVYIQRDQELPPENILVEITGRNILAPRILQNRGDSVRAISVDEIQIIGENITDNIHPNTNLRDLSKMLFEHVGMAEASKRVFARLFVSSPPHEGAIGGLTTGIQALASERKVQRLFSLIKSVVPPALRGKGATSVNFRGIRVPKPKIWRLESGKTVRSKLEELCIRRRDPSGFSEVSLGTMTTQSTAALPDVPIALTSEEFWIETRNASELRLPITKAAITYKLLNPSVSHQSIDAGTKHALKRLEVIKESFGLENSALSRGNVLDADALGRPMSMIRLALSSARAYWKEKITVKQLKREWDRVLEPALREFLELSDIKEKAEARWGKDSRYDRYDSRILKALEKLDAGKTGSLGPKLAEIAEEAGVEQHETAQTLTKMKEDGTVYEPRIGHYRLV